MNIYNYFIPADEETAVAFERHFESQINLYREQVIVNLINQSGRERVRKELCVYYLHNECVNITICVPHFICNTVCVHVCVVVYHLSFCFVKLC